LLSGEQPFLSSIDPEIGFQAPPRQPWRDAWWADMAAARNAHRVARNWQSIEP